MIKSLNVDKVTLAKELANEQEKIYGVDGASVDKNIKLTKDLKNKSNECKSLEKERNDLKANLSKYQLDMNSKNNKVAEIEAQNVKLNWTTWKQAKTS